MSLQPGCDIAQCSAACMKLIHRELACRADEVIATDSEDLKERVAQITGAKPR